MKSTFSDNPLAVMIFQTIAATLVPDISSLLVYKTQAGRAEYYSGIFSRALQCSVFWHISSVCRIVYVNHVFPLAVKRPGFVLGCA